MKYLKIKIKFNVKDGTFKIKSNIKKDQYYNIIENFLYRQIGKGIDDSERKTKKVYTIILKWNPQYDNIYCQFDGGNLGLRDGLLMYVLSKL